MSDVITILGSLNIVLGEIGQMTSIVDTLISQLSFLGIDSSDYFYYCSL